MRGTYTFKQDGLVIARSENLITSAGRKAIIDYMAGYIQKLAGSILLGIGTTAANVVDESLDFEVYRVPVELSSADYVNGAVVFKGVIPAEAKFTAYEAGIQTLYMASQQFGSQLLLNFDSEVDTWTAGTFDSTNSRIGEALRLTSAASTTTTASLSGIYYDLSGYSAVDQFLFAYRANNAFVSSIAVRLKTDSSNYYSFSIPTPASGTYAITKINKGSLTTTGSPSWDNITTVDILVTSTAGGTGGVDFDALRIEDRDSESEDNVLVSRSVLTTPVVKLPDIPLDVEYTITL